MLTISTPKTTSWVVTALGTAVSLAGYKMLPRRIGAGLMGFGAAHVALGLLDRIRPTVKKL